MMKTNELVSNFWIPWKFTNKSCHFPLFINKNVKLFQQMNIDVFFLFIYRSNKLFPYSFQNPFFQVNIKMSIKAYAVAHTVFEETK